VADEPGRNITLGEPKLDYIVGLVSFDLNKADSMIIGVYTTVGPSGIGCSQS